MYCPYCGKKNDDSAQYCAECGQPIKEDLGFSEPNQSAGPDSSGGFDDGSGNRNRGMIIAIIVIVAAAVVAILFITNVFPWPFNGRDNDVETEEIADLENGGENSAAGFSDVIDLSEGQGEEKEEEEEERSENSEAAVPEEVDEQTDTIEDIDIEQYTTEDVVYDKNDVLSTLYEVWDENSATTLSYVYGLTYSTGSEDPARITDLTDESDTEVLEKMKKALRDDQSSGHLAGTEAQINSLTLNDIEYGDDGRELSFIVEGGEIVLLVNDGDLLPSGSDFLKVPIDVYISTMSYDEYTADYIFSDSSTRKLEREDLVGLSKEELRLARNEIFARHGRIYEDENLNDYFSKKSWYHGTADEDHFDMDLITDREWENLATLNAYDREMGYQTYEPQ